VREQELQTFLTLQLPCPLESGVVGTPGASVLEGREPRTGGVSRPTAQDPQLKQRNANQWKITVGNGIMLVHQW